MEHSALQPILDTALASFAKLLEQDRTAEPFPNLLDTTEAVVELAQQLGRRMMQSYVDSRLKQVKQRRVSCECGEATMQWHSKSTWTHGTPFGDVTVEDIYAYCRKCHRSARPLHGWLGTDAQRWSPVVEQEAMDLGTDESCQHAVDKLKRHHPGVEMGRTTLLRLLHKHGGLALDAAPESYLPAVAFRCSVTGAYQGPAITPGVPCPLDSARRLWYSPGRPAAGT